MSRRKKGHVVRINIKLGVNVWPSLLLRIYRLNHPLSPNSRLYKLFSTASKSPITPLQFSHSLSPPGNPPINGNLVPSLSPKLSILLTASLIPTVPNFTTSSSTALSLYCNALISFFSSALTPSLTPNSYNLTTDFGKNPAEPSMVPTQPMDKTGTNCCPSPVKVWKAEWSIKGWEAIWMCVDTSPWDSLQPTIFGCWDSVANVEGVTLTLLETPG